MSSRYEYYKFNPHTYALSEEMQSVDTQKGLNLPTFQRIQVLRQKCIVTLNFTYV